MENQNELIPQEWKNLFQYIIRDEIPVKIIPWMTQGIVFLCLLIYSAQFEYPEYFNLFVLLGALNPASLRFIYTLYQLITYQFIHIDFWHIAFNMAFLWCVGDNVEEKLGSKYFLIAYIFSGVFAGLGFASFLIIFYPLICDTMIIGASGSIAGIMAGYLLLVKENNFIILNQYKINSKIFIASWFIEQLIYSFTEPLGAVAYLGHVFGFIAGAVLCYALYQKKTQEK
jgi:membrane associated rhomboid family serine protease